MRLRGAAPAKWRHWPRAPILPTLPTVRYNIALSRSMQQTLHGLQQLKAARIEEVVLAFDDTGLTHGAK